MWANHKADGSNYVMGRLNPDVEGYNGKTWENRNPAATLMDSPWGTSAFEVGGPRESTRNMGNTTTQTERGYTVQHQPWNMIDEGSDIGIPNQQGELATGGTLNVATEGMDIGQIPLGALRSMMGFGGGKNNTGFESTLGNGQWDGSQDIISWARKHPWLWRAGKFIGNAIVPGAATIGDAALRLAARHGYLDNQPGHGEGT